MKGLILALLVASFSIASTLELIVTEAELQEALEECIVDTRISDLDVDIQRDVIVLTAIRTLPLQTVDLMVEIWLEPDLGEGANIWAVKSGTANDHPFNETRIELWNTWFNDGMHGMAQTELGRADIITIVPDEITFIWE